SSDPTSGTWGSGSARTIAGLASHLQQGGPTGAGSAPMAAQRDWVAVHCRGSLRTAKWPARQTIKTKPMLNKSDPPSDKKEPVVIKKYANRRLYNTETSTYVTLDDLAAMVKSERDFVVFDAKTGDDLTHSVLTQIIVEQESRMGTQTLL